MAEGTIWWVNEAMGYALIRPDAGGRDLIVRSADVAIGGTEPLEKGAEVGYEAKGRKKGIRYSNISVGRYYSYRDESVDRHTGKEVRRENYEGL